jgi:hypothetical protein
VFEPPWPFGSDSEPIRSAWRVLQWRETRDGEQKEREALEHLDALVPELEFAEGKAIVTALPELRAQLEGATASRGRERLFRRGGSQAWLRVVVEFAGARDRVITAFPQSNDPEGWKHR